VQSRRVIHNSFDMINPLIIDEGGELKRKQPPLVFRAGTREVHNKLEKHRRAHLKECFDILKRQLTWTTEEKKTSNLNILHAAFKTINALKKRERELEHEMEQLAKDKIANTTRLLSLKKEFAAMDGDVDINALLLDYSEPVQNAEKKEIKEEFSDNDERIPRKSPIDDDDSKKSITKALLVSGNATELVAPVAVNGVKDGVVNATTTTTTVVTPAQQVQTTALSILPLNYQVNQPLLVQKVIVPKNLADFSQLVSSAPVTHFIAPQQLGGKMVPIVNTQYLVKPLVVVSTPSRPS